MTRPTIYGDYKVDSRYLDGGLLGGSWIAPPRKTFHVSIIPPGRTGSTYHARMAAIDSSAAVEHYINANPAHSTGAKVAQTVGGVVVCTPILDTVGGDGIPPYGQEVFRVEPVTPPPPPKHARIVGRV